MTHLRFDPAFAASAARSGVRIVFVVRDPRDVVISQTKYVVGRRDHWAHELYAARSGTAERLRLAIAGDPTGRPRRSLGDRLAEYAGWLDAADVVVRFEDLVGSRGRGDDERQRDTVRRIFGEIGVPADDALITSIASRLFSDESPTFRKGTIGQWRDVFDDDLRVLVDEVAGEQLARYGYAD